MNVLIMNVHRANVHEISISLYCTGLLIINIQQYVLNSKYYGLWVTRCKLRWGLFGRLESDWFPDLSA